MFFISTQVSNIINSQCTLKRWECYSICTSSHAILLYKLWSGVAPKNSMKVFPCLIQCDVPVHFGNICWKGNFMESESYQNRENVFLHSTAKHQWAVEWITSCGFGGFIKDNSQIRNCRIFLVDTVSDAKESWHDILACLILIQEQVLDASEIWICWKSQHSHFWGRRCFPNVSLNSKSDVWPRHKCPPKVWRLVERHWYLKLVFDYVSYFWKRFSQASSWSFCGCRVTWWD